MVASSLGKASRLSSVVVLELDSLESVAERRLKDKIKHVLENPSHPLYNKLLQNAAHEATRSSHPGAKRSPLGANLYLQPLDFKWDLFNKKTYIKQLLVLLKRHPHLKFPRLHKKEVVLCAKPPSNPISPREKPSLWTSQTFSDPYQACSAAICSSVFTWCTERTRR